MSVVFLVENFGALRACPPPSHSRCASLDTLAPSTPCFGRFRCGKNNIELFLHCYPVLKEITKKVLLCRAFFVISLRTTMIALAGKL